MSGIISSSLIIILATVGILSVVLYITITVEDFLKGINFILIKRLRIGDVVSVNNIAEIIMKQEDSTPLEEIAKEYIKIEKDNDGNIIKDKTVETAEDAIAGAKDIIAEDRSDNSEYREQIKKL